MTGLRLVSASGAGAVSPCEPVQSDRHCKQCGKESSVLVSYNHLAQNDNKIVEETVIIMVRVA